MHQSEHVVNLYGRCLGAAFAHRFLPGSKGGLYAWEKVRHCAEIILVEGLFDYAVLRQAGFQNVTCSLGTHLNTTSSTSSVKANAPSISSSTSIRTKAGNRLHSRLAHRLGEHGIAARRVLLPAGHDPNSFFVGGGDAQQFQSLLKEARP